MKPGWEVKSLGEVCQLDKQKHKGGPSKYVGMENIASGTGLLAEPVSKKQVKSDTFSFTQKHVLYGRLRAYLNKVLVPNFSGHCSTEVFPLLPDATLDRRFLFYWLTSKDIMEDINATSTGARMPRANFKEVMNFDFPLPPLKEQRRIVAVLDEAFEGLDRARKNTETNLTNARELVTSYRERLLRADQPGWVTRHLSEVITIKHGFAFKSEFFRKEADYILLTPGNFFEEGGYRHRGLKQKFYDGPIPEGFTLKSGDVLVAMTEQAPGLLGSCIIVPDNQRFLHNQRLGLIQEKVDGELCLAYLAEAFNLISLRKSLSETCTGIKVRHTSPDKIKANFLPFPPTVEEQERLVREFSRIRDSINNLIKLSDEKLNDLKDLRQSILQKAFAGELTASTQYAVATPANDNASPDFAASVLAYAYNAHVAKEQQNTFGHVKAQKILHLVEALAGIDMGREPVKDRAGPNDMAHMRGAEDWAREEKLFYFEERPKGYTFIRMGDFDRGLRRAEEQLEAIAPVLEHILGVLVPMNSKQAEAVATTYAAWNNFIIDGIEPTDAQIARAASVEWHTDKKLTEAECLTALAVLRREELIPDGSAKYVGKQRNLL